MAKGVLRRTLRVMDCFEMVDCPEVDIGGFLATVYILRRTTTATPENEVSLLRMDKVEKEAVKEMKKKERQIQIDREKRILDYRRQEIIPARVLRQQQELAEKAAKDAAEGNPNAQPDNSETDSRPVKQVRLSEDGDEKNDK